MNLNPTNQYLPRVAQDLPSATIARSATAALRKPSETPTTASFAAMLSRGKSAPASADPHEVTSKTSSVATHERAAKQSTLTHQPTEAEREAQEVASKLASQLFYFPLLQQMREFELGQRFANGGRTEAIFGERFDQHIADLVAANDRSGLVDALARQFTRKPAEPRHNARNTSGATS